MLGHQAAWTSCEEGSAAKALQSLSVGLGSVRSEADRNEANASLAGKDHQSRSSKFSGAEDLLKRSAMRLEGGLRSAA